MRQWLFCLLSACALHLTVSAHVLDQYLQVAQIALAPDGVRIELRLIPGVQVADRICTLIDADGNGQISTAEEQAYARRVWQDIELAVNGVNTPLTLTEMQFPTQQKMREGLGTIRLILTAAATLGAADQQQIYFRNNHVPELGVYLVNALVPTTNEIKIRGQERDPLQRELRLRFHLTPTDTRGPRPWTGVLMFCLCLLLLLPQWKRLRQFLRRGAEKKMYARKIVS
jgi:hypothetical protein